MESSDSKQETPTTSHKRQLQLEAANISRQIKETEQQLLKVSKKSDESEKKLKQQKDTTQTLIKQTLADLKVQEPYPQPVLDQNVQPIIQLDSQNKMT